MTSFPRISQCSWEIPERRVPLPGGRRASQTDLFVLARSSDGLVTIAVEGKVEEAFGPLVSEWLTEDASPGKHERLAFLADRLGADPNGLGPLRYQLLHRTASALIEAKEFGAVHAVMLVHSFSPANAGLDDYRSFAKALGVQGDAGLDRVVSLPETRDGVRLHLAWACGEPEYLAA